MRKTINRETVAGRVYSHKLAMKTVQNTASENYGKPFINGSIDVATDDECLNVITVNFTYVTEFTKSGSKNATYTALAKIINEGKTVALDGKEFATKVSISTSLGVNDFYTTRNGQEELVSAKRNDGGFVTIVDTLNANEDERKKFEVDMLVNGTKMIEADEEKHIPADYLEVKGYVFNFRGEMQPVTMVCKKPEGINFFEDLEVSGSNPAFLKVKGVINNTTININKEEETAFGESVVTYTRNIREWVIMTGNVPYEIGDAENGITKEEIQKLISDRNIYLAGVKKRQEDYQASKAAAAPTPSVASAPAAEGGFVW